MAQPASRYVFGNLAWYSLLVVTGMATAILLAMREERRVGLPKDTVLDLCLWMIPFGIIGARLYYCALAWPTFQRNPVSVLYIWEGGLAIYGGLLAGLLMVILFCGRRKLPLLQVLDVVILGVPLAQAIGRWGNYFNMEAYGLTVTDPRWQFFPFAVLIGHGGDAQWHLATFFYESVWDLLIFILLWRSRKEEVQAGDRFFRYTALYALGRQAIEGLRLDSLYFGSFRASQLLAMAAVMGVCVLWLRRSGSWRRAWYLFAPAALCVCRLALPQDNLRAQTVISLLFLLTGFIAIALCRKEAIHARNQAEERAV